MSKEIDTTSVHTEGFRTYAAPVVDKFKNAMESFKALSPIPEQIIQLGDGRVLSIQEWAPKADCDCIGFLPVVIKGLISIPDQK